MKKLTEDTEVIDMDYEKSHQIKTEDVIEKELVNAEWYLNVVNVITVALDRKGNITLLNKKGCEILEYEEEELLGKNWFETCLPVEDRYRVYDYFNKLINGEIEIIKCYENAIMTKNGNKKIIAWSTDLFRDNHGFITGLLSSGEDITERKEAEQKLKESEEKYRLITENVNDVISVFDKNFNLIYINAAGERLSGFSKDEVLVRKPQGFMHPDDINRSIKIFQEAVKTGEGFGEFRMRRKDGSYVWLETNAKIINDEKGETKAILVSRDITKRKLMEEKLKESEKQYRQIANELKIILDHLPGLVFYKDKNNNFIHINQNVVDYYNSDIVSKGTKLTKKDFEGKNLFDLLPDDIAQAYWDDDLEVINSGKPKLNIEESFETEQGTRWIITNKIPYVNENGETTGIIGFSMEITEKKRAEEIIKEENKKLLELDQMRKDLITRVSHELKTPLTSIFSCSELLLEHYTDRIDDDILKFIEIIHRGGQRLNYLIMNLLDTSQIESGKLNLCKGKTNLVKTIKKSIKHIEYLAVYRNHSLNIELPEELYLEVDEIRIKQVLTNLLSNAIKNTPSNGNIDLSLKKNGTYSYITIKDTGVGLTEKEMEKIFKKFGKIERYGKQLDVDIEGSGLGLYISKEIIELHDGQIWVESEGRNKGATFIVKLPII